MAKPAYPMEVRDGKVYAKVPIGVVLKDVDPDGTDFLAAVKRLYDENAKLQELAKAAWGCVNRHVSCDECRMVCGGCTLQSAMRELGIEVK